jgi:hypothetical protein
MDFDSFKQLIKDFNTSDKHELNLVKSIEINGYVYRAIAEEENDIVIKVKEMKVIEKIFAKKEKWICDVMAVLFKREDLTSKEHFEPAHLKVKSKLFIELNGAICIPYIVKIGQLVKNELEQHQAEPIL